MEEGKLIHGRWSREMQYEPTNQHRLFDQSNSLQDPWWMLEWPYWGLSVQLCVVSVLTFMHVYLAGSPTRDPSIRWTTISPKDLIAHRLLSTSVFIGSFNNPKSATTVFSAIEEGAGGYWICPRANVADWRCVTLNDFKSLINLPVC